MCYSVFPENFPAELDFLAVTDFPAGLDSPVLQKSPAELDFLAVMDFPVRSFLPDATILPAQSSLPVGSSLPIPPDVSYK